jgi:hypothetical protein
MQPLACLRIALASVLVLAVFGCGSSGKKSAGSEKESVAEALSKHVHFAHQLSRRGDIGKQDDATRKVKLSGAAGLHIAPNGDSLMSLDAENPDQDDNAAKNVLCQFAGAEGHSEIPVKDVLADRAGGDDAVRTGPRARIGGPGADQGRRCRHDRGGLGAVCGWRAAVAVRRQGGRRHGLALVACARGAA